MLYSFWGCGHIGVTILCCIVLGVWSHRSNHIMLYSFGGCGHIGVTILCCIVLGGVVTLE